MSKLYLHAPNVHTGGGLSLLQAILDVEPTPFNLANLDARVRPKLRIQDEITTNFIARSLFGRLFAEWNLRRNCSSDDVVLCLNSMPPLFGVRGKAIVFVQNRLLLEPALQKNHSLLVLLRIALERLWLRQRSRAASRFIVQTQSMAQLLRYCVGLDQVISVMPFVSSQTPASVEKSSEKERADFVYVASGEPHKNHIVLLEAWRLLKQWGLTPSLWLTIDPMRFASLSEQVDKAVYKDGVKIKNLGWLSTSVLFDIYNRSDALIYPSLNESLGLPLLEAAQANLDILAAERDYVRDVATPVQTFDPASPLSIARAVCRHLKRAKDPLKLYSASEFLAELLQTRH